MRPASGVAALVASAVVGVLAGVGAHAVVPAPGASGTPSPSVTTPSAPPATHSGTPLPSFLGDANTLQVDDLAALGWRGDKVKESTAEGDAQAPVTCQRQGLSQTGHGINAMMNGYWSHLGSAIADESVNEILAQYSTVDQARDVSLTIQDWFAHCTSLESDGGVAGPSQRVSTDAAGIVWWRVEVGGGKHIHEGVARGANRVALVAAYSPTTTDAQFIALMGAAAKRLVQ